MCRKDLNALLISSHKIDKFWNKKLWLIMSNTVHKGNKHSVSNRYSRQINK